MPGHSSNKAADELHIGLTDLIERYLVSVSEAYSAFLDTGLCDAPGSHIEWATNGIAHNGDIASGGHYQKLAYGLHIERNGQSVAFDFGQDGETHEFDAYRLSQYWGDNHRPTTVRSVRELETAFAEAVQNGVVQITASSKYRLV